MRGFKEDFMQWKSSLTSDEKAMLLRQTHGEFDKKYRKTDEFDQDLPQEKAEALGKALEKYFDSEAEDYVKQRDSKAPDYDYIKRKCARKAYDWSMTNTLVEVDRNAWRLNDVHDQKMENAKEMGEPLPKSGSPLKDFYKFSNSKESEHKVNVKVYEFAKEVFEGTMKEMKDVKADDKKRWMDIMEKLAPPPQGEDGWKLVGHEILNRQYDMAGEEILKYQSENPEKLSDEVLNATVAGLFRDINNALTESYYSEMLDLQEAANEIRDGFRDQKYEEGKKRSDYAKAFHAAVTEYNKKEKKDPPPPLDEEYLAELDKKPLPKPGDPEFRHPWNTADVLYKSEAYDSFGQKYLLGLFETKKEAQEVFKKWNDEYTEARAKLKEEVVQWGKQQQAILDKDPAAQERVRKAIEEKWR